jgi:tRNA1(Val) A37 N6-methylase TrmN6
MRASVTSFVPMTGEACATTEDAILGGRLVLRQPRRGHRFGHDAILLAAAVDAAPGGIVVEFGAGVGAAGLALAQRVPGVSIVLVEVDAMLAELARANAARNNLAARVTVATLDVNAPAQDFARVGLAPESVNHVLMNPPFNDPARQNVSPDTARRRAHAGNGETLALWIARASSLLMRSGTLTLIWRADGLSDVLAALAGFGGIAVLPIHPKPSVPAIRVLVRAVKGSAAPLALLAPLVLNGAEGRPSGEAEAVLRGGAPLRMP